MSYLILVTAVIAANLLMSFFFSGSETAVISANQYNLRHRREEGDQQAARTLAVLSRASALMSAVLIGVSIGQTFVALFFKLLLDRLWPAADEIAFGPIRWDELISLIVLTPFVVVFAEILPKALFRAKADAWIHNIRPALSFFMFIFYPVIYSLDRLVDFFLWPFGGRDGHRGPRLTRSDLILMLNAPTLTADTETPRKEEPTEAGAAQAPMAPPASQKVDSDQAAADEEPDERRLIQNIIELEQTQVREIMQPLIELEAVQLGRTTVDAFLEQARRSGYTRFPAYKTRIVNMIGYVNVYDLLRDGREKTNLEDILRPGYYVPETKRVDDLLQEFLLQRINNAIVVDEFGGCSGWITREDILEEIVGELGDELDVPVRLIDEQPDGSFIMEGKVHTESVDEALGTDFENDTDCDTLGGIIMKQLGRIPKSGDSLMLHGWPIEILSMDGLRVGRVKVLPKKGHPEAAPTPES